MKTLILLFVLLLPSVVLADPPESPTYSYTYDFWSSQHLANIETSLAAQAVQVQALNTSVIALDARILELKTASDGMAQFFEPASIYFILGVVSGYAFILGLGYEG